MEKNYSIAEARNHLAALVHRAEEGHPVQIMRRGQPVAVLLSEKEYARLASGQSGFWDALAAFRKTIGPDEAMESDDVFSRVRDKATGRNVAL